MRKMLVIAAREYLAAVRTKTFIIGLVILPVMMGGSILLQWLLRNVVDTRDKHFVLVSHAAPARLIDHVKGEIVKYNGQVVDATTGRQLKPRFLVGVEDARKTSAEQDQRRLQLSDLTRSGALVGFMDITPAASSKETASVAEPHVQVLLRYHTNRPAFTDFSTLVERAVQEFSRGELSAKHKLTPAQTQALVEPVTIEKKGLVHKDATTGRIEESSKQGQFAPLIVPAVLMMLMFMVILMTATPLMQGVVEEKMQRIAEVLLGSVRPFELMMGKIVGMVGVSLTIAAVYLGGAYWAAHYYGFAEHIGFELMIWFVVFQALAGLMYGSLFIAVGAACTDMKETQNLMWPVMLLACLPIFLLGNVIREPNNAVVRGLSFFPFATPALMIARVSSPPGIPWWEPALGAAGVLATTILCVYAAGRIFRVGLLIQGKGARLGQIAHWVLRG